MRIRNWLIRELYELTNQMLDDKLKVNTGIKLDPGTREFILRKEVYLDAFIRVIINLTDSLYNWIFCF